LNKEEAAAFEEKLRRAMKKAEDGLMGFAGEEAK